jgi:hypothetical protein
MIGISWASWKHAMLAYATAKQVKIPAAFNLKADRCGKGCSILMKRIQAHAGLAQDGILGPRTAALLRPWFPDDPTAARTRMSEVCQWGVNQNASIHYDQRRPMNLNDIVLPITEDCSTYATFGAYWANLPDPNGLHYSGSGNTETMYYHLPKISLAQAHVGDLVIWGGAVIQSLSHVVVLAEHGKADPLVYSHGFEGGPLKLSLNSEASYHGGLAMTVHKII